MVNSVHTGIYCRDVGWNSVGNGTDYWLSVMVWKEREIGGIGNEFENCNH